MHVPGACGEPVADPAYAGQSACVQPTAALERLGGVADRPMLLRLTTRRRLRTSLARGDITRVGRNRYALPTAHEGLLAAGRLAGVASHATAAAIHGWPLARQTPPSVIVPRNRKVEAPRRTGVRVRWRDLEATDVIGMVTEPHRTVIDCARDLHFDDALAITDSALRSRSVDRERLLTMARALPTTGRRKALRVVLAADPRSANPFESVLRALALEVGLAVEPQVVISDRGFLGRPDLVDRRRRLVLEADSFAFHGTRKALRRDCERYNALVVRGWTVLRFSWEHVMLSPDYVRALLAAAADRPDGRAALSSTLLYSA